MRAQKAAVRALPAFLMLIAVVFFGNLAKPGLERRAKGWGGEPLDRMPLTPPASPLATPQELSCPAIDELIGISKRASTLTGSLALLAKDDRPKAASGAAAQIRALKQQAAGLPGGAELARALGDLAGALEKYAGGGPSPSSRQVPSAIGDLREASARNAGVRAILYQQQRLCGGDNDE
jgi:hypothetical protein